MYITRNAEGGKTAFISAYAPTATASFDQKESFYDNLTTAINEVRAIYYIGGDFNARIYNIREGEQAQIGRNIIEREPEYVNSRLSPPSKENRDLFVNLLKTHDAKKQ